MKKIILGILIFNLLYGVTALGANINQEALVGLQDLGIVDKSDDLRFDDYITKAEAIKMIAVASALTPVDHVEPTVQPFVDVPLNHWAVKYITVCKWEGIIDGDDDGCFYPDNTVTSQEMQKMLVAALGYTPYAENLGGYPGGYLAVANNLKINEAVTDDDLLTRNGAMIMLNNALDVPILELAKQAVEFDGSFTKIYHLRDGENYPFLSLRMQLLEWKAEVQAEN